MISRLTAVTGHPIGRTALAVATLVTLTAGCSQIAERATEEAVERAVEADSGEDVDFEIDDDGFSIETEEGDITFSANGDGIEIEGTDEDGNDFSLDATENGLEIDGADGESVYDAGEGIPDEWPSDVPAPDGLSDVYGTYVSEGGQESVLVTGSTDGNASDVFDEYAERLTGAGFDETATSSPGDGFRTATYAKGERTVSVTAQSSDGRTDLIVVIGE
ncbi:hypothetical protein [Ilumatobacter sp.]|uniref:hypothetical protein n=1 Tax=Ilumatobacter sp. TaxID=1967498 RepID=UPI003C472843